MRQLLMAACVLTLCVWGTSFAGEGDPPVFCFDGADGLGEIDEGGLGNTFDVVVDEADDLTIADLNISVDMTHPSLFDIDLTISGPDGTSVFLFSGVDLKVDEADMLVIWDEEGDVTYLGDDLDCACTMESSGLELDGLLSDFDGGNLAGTWTLTIDDFGEGLGKGEVRNLNEFCLEPTAAASFIRGDCNGNGDLVVLTDMIFLLDWQLNEGTAPDCEDACDLDGVDGVQGIDDALYGLFYQFLSGPAPIGPFPDCGISTEATGNSCDNSTCEVEKP